MKHIRLAVDVFLNVGLVLVVMSICYLLAAAATSVLIPPVPQCQEDEIIVGQGDFSGGFWDSYSCAPADGL